METTINIDRSSIVSQVKTAFDELIDLLSSLSEEQLNRVPFEGSWTAAQVGDHLLQSYGVAETIKGNTTATQRRIDMLVKPIAGVFLNFETKLKSPEFIIPRNEHISKQELIQQLQEITADISHSLDTLDLSETCLDFELPTMGLLTRWEWGHFVLYHTQRHIHQLKNITEALKK